MLIIRQYEPDDLDATVGVWERSRWDAQRWIEERMGYSHDDNVRYFRDVLSQHARVWLAVADGAVVGLMAIAENRIEQLFIEPGRQGQGIGSALMDHAKVLPPDGLTLFTHQRNERARAFYEHRGFRAVAFGVSPAPESEPDVRYDWEP